MNGMFLDNVKLSCKSEQLLDFIAENPNNDPCSFLFVPEEMAFSTNNVNIVSYFWDFGDGTNDVTQNTLATPLHSYVDEGEYKVTLYIVDSNGCCQEIGKMITCMRENCISPLQVMADYQPIAGAPDVNNQCTYEMISTVLPPPPIPVVFPVPTVVSYLWDFGDGNTSTSANPIHTFNGYGTYYGSLTITDSDGCTKKVYKKFICSRCVNYVCYEDYYSYGECVGGVAYIDPSGANQVAPFNQSILELNIQDIANATENALANDGFAMNVLHQDPTGIIGCTKFDLDPTVFGVPDISLDGFFFYGDVQVVGFVRNEDCNANGLETPLTKVIIERDAAGNIIYVSVYNPVTGLWELLPSTIEVPISIPYDLVAPFNTCP